MLGQAAGPWWRGSAATCAAPCQLPTRPSTSPLLQPDTFWYAVVRGAAPHETLQLEHPPTSYYSAPCEGLEAEARRPLRLASGRAAAAAADERSAAPALTAA